MLSLARTAQTRSDPFAALRAREFARLDAQNLAYLDYAAAGLYGASQVGAYAAALQDGVFGNPHSEHGPSRRSEEVLHRARTAALAFFDADPADYDLCFVANTTAAIKLVAESYPFDLDCGLVLAADNHNSVNGMREYARAARAPVTVLPLSDELRLDDPQGRLDALARAGARTGLLAFPVQSNFSGVRHPLALADTAQALGFDVLLDAAAVGPAHGLRLSTHPVSFLAFSFYKLFGLPTGLGALIVRKEAIARLRRPWFSGGTVDYVSVKHDRHQLRSGHEGFEDGTPNFLGAAALEPGFALLAQVDPAELQQRLARLTARFLDAARTLTHANGAPAVRLYGPADMQDRGCTIAFNLLTPEGAPVPFQHVEREARAAGVALRGGCFCNPGAAERAFGFAALDVPGALDALGPDFTIPAFQQRLGQGAAVGAVRLSLGLPTNAADIDRAVALVAGMAH